MTKYTKEQIEHIMFQCSRATRPGDISRILNANNMPIGTYYREKIKFDVPNISKTEERLILENKIVTLYKEDKDITMDGLAEVFDFHRVTIGRILKKHGINETKYRLKKEISEDDTKIRILYSVMQMSYQEILKQTGISESKINNSLTKQKIPIINKRKKSNVKYECLWCRHKDYAWTTGKRAQKYCSSSCSNKVTDIRRKKRTPKAMLKLATRFKQTWGNKAIEKSREISADFNKIIQTL